MNKVQLFKSAWQIARNGAAAFGGSVKSYFASALRMAYLTATRVQETQKEIALWLDMAADRACHVNREGATRKQVWFLAGLLFKAGENADSVTGSNTNYILTKREASALIDTFI